tara:strand:+ start:28 stop:546 length:519 start_codon:yes stop_codon:yes gene_type:complete
MTAEVSSYSDDITSIIYVYDVTDLIADAPVLKHTFKQNSRICIDFHNSLPLFVRFSFFNSTLSVFDNLMDTTAHEYKIKGNYSQIDMIVFHNTLPLLMVGSQKEEVGITIFDTTMFPQISIKHKFQSFGFTCNRFTITFHPNLPILTRNIKKKSNKYCRRLFYNLNKTEKCT